MEPDGVRCGAAEPSYAVFTGRRPTRGANAILSKWFLPTRLETRTKESKTHASMVVEKPTCEMKVIGAKRKRQLRPTQWTS